MNSTGVHKKYPLGGATPRGYFLCCCCLVLLLSTVRPPADDVVNVICGNTCSNGNKNRNDNIH